jgi:hypothetical protein
MLLSAAKYVLAGLFIWLVGAIFFGDAISFAARSVPAELRVVSIDSKIEYDNSDGHLRRYYMYRPVFALKDAKPPAKRYAGNIWMSVAPHRTGDVVPGRFDAARGEMRSDRMQAVSIWLGRLAMVLGVLVGLQSLALLFGVPEEFLPLRVSAGRNDRTSPEFQ